MSEERLARLEDMMGQLIGMVGKVLGEQQSMKQDMQTMNDRTERIEKEQIRFNDSHSYILEKLAQHDHDIHILKTKALKV